MISGCMLETNVYPSETNIRTVSTFCQGRFGKDKYQLYRDIVNKKVCIFISDSEMAMMEKLKGIIEEINDIMGYNNEENPF